MPDTLSIKRGDTSPGVEYRLGVYADGSGVLSGASARFLMARPGSAPIVDEAAEIADVDGVLRYGWATGDTAASGVYRAEFEVTFADGHIETFPSSGWLTITISPDIG